VRYSHHPIPAYHLDGVAQDEVSVIQGLTDSIPVWNLFWLSSPTIDLVPTTGKRWFKHYSPVQGLLVAVMRDVAADVVTMRKLMMHPLAFAEWFERQEPANFRTSQASGRDDWAALVLQRCKEASDRMLETNPPVTITGNVISVNFRAAA